MDESGQTYAAMLPDFQGRKSCNTSERKGLMYLVHARSEPVKKGRCRGCARKEERRREGGGPEAEGVDGEWFVLKNFGCHVKSQQGLEGVELQAAQECVRLGDAPVVSGRYLPSFVQRRRMLCRFGVEAVRSFQKADARLSKLPLAGAAKSPEPDFCFGLASIRTTEVPSSNTGEHGHPSSTSYFWPMCSPKHAHLAAHASVWSYCHRGTSHSFPYMSNQG